MSTHFYIAYWGPAEHKLCDYFLSMVPRDIMMYPLINIHSVQWQPKENPPRCPPFLAEPCVRTLPLETRRCHFLVPSDQCISYKLQKRLLPWRHLCQSKKKNIYKNYNRKGLSDMTFEFSNDGMGGGDVIVCIVFSFDNLRFISYVCIYHVSQKSVKRPEKCLEYLKYFCFDKGMLKNPEYDFQ